MRLSEPGDSSTVIPTQFSRTRRIPPNYAKSHSPIATSAGLGALLRVSAHVMGFDWSRNTFAVPLRE